MLKVGLESHNLTFITYVFIPITKNLLKMNCIIPGANLKIMSKVLQTLVKIGDELYIEANDDHLQFASINQNKTAYSKFNFHPSFFTNFAVQAVDHRVTCKVYVKSVFNVFKSKSLKEKKIEWCKINLDEDASKIIFKLKYKHDVTIVHNLRLIDKELIEIDYDLRTLPNEVTATGEFLQQILGNFQTTDEDMNLEIKENNIVIRNYDLHATINKGIRSQIVLRSTEFLYYNVEGESHITMCFKPFRAAASFCEGFNLNVVLNFDSDGKPVVLTIRNPTFDAGFVLSTINSHGDAESGVETVGRRANVTVQDREVLENINWDSDFDVNDCKPSSVVDVDIVPGSPESPRSKRLKLVFGRCFEATFRPSQDDFGEMLVPDSDPE